MAWRATVPAAVGIVSPLGAATAADAARTAAAKVAATTGRFARNLGIEMISMLAPSLIVYRSLRAGGLRPETSLREHPERRPAASPMSLPGLSQQPPAAERSVVARRNCRRDRRLAAAPRP